MITEAFCTSHNAYKNQTGITVKGLVLHSIGCSQPDCQKVRDNWNSNPTCAIAHYTLDDTKILQCLPDTCMAWHIGSPGNSCLIGCEMGEPSEISYDGVTGYNPIVAKIKSCSAFDKLKAKKYCTDCYNNAVELFAGLCEKYNLDPYTQIYTHYYLSTNKLYNCNSHIDPQHLWDGLQLGFSIETFRSAVANRMGIAKKASESDETVANSLLTIARDEIGYHEKATNAKLDDKTANSGDGNWNKYADELYKAGYYAKQNKNGYSWCAVFVDWLFYRLNNCDSQKAQAMQYQSGDGGASCTYSAKYYQNANRWSNEPSIGAEIFFGGNLGMEHTGIVESFNDSYVVTIEGNTSDQVARRTYARSNSRIKGYGKPNFSLFDGKIQAKVESNTSTVTKTHTSVRYGDRSEAVNEMQEDLISLGYSCGNDGADGCFGIETKKAVLAFQKDAFPNTPTEWDGACGAKTWAKIDERLSKIGDAYIPSVGDIVNFTGDTHYISAYSDKGSDCKPGKARITMIANANTKHPYHLIKTSGSQSTVHGFVDLGTFIKA